MSGDVKLKDTGVEVVGVLEVGELTPSNRQLKINGWDLILDCKDRRKPDSETTSLGTIHHSPVRRALVHDVGDKLTVNYGGDYPGGVTITGSTSMETLTVSKHFSGPVATLTGYSWYGAPKAITCFAQDLILSDRDTDKKDSLKNVALSHLPGDKLVINRANGYTGGVELQGSVTVADKLTVQGLDLVAEIKLLKEEIKTLKAKLGK